MKKLIKHWLGLDVLERRVELDSVTQEFIGNRANYALQLALDLTSENLVKKSGFLDKLTKKKAKSIKKKITNIKKK